MRPVRGVRPPPKGFDAGPDCESCGYKRVNVRHDDPEKRRDRIDRIYGYGYYAANNVPYHPFVAGPSQEETK